MAAGSRGNAVMRGVNPRPNQLTINLGPYGPFSYEEKK